MSGSYVILYDFPVPRACCCGGHPEMVMDYVNDYVVRCNLCHISTHAFMDAEDAAAAWQEGKTKGRLDLINYDVVGALSGDVESIWVKNDCDFWMVNNQSFDCDEIILKLRDKSFMYLIQSSEGYLDIGYLNRFNEKMYNRKIILPEKGVSLLHVANEQGIPETLTFRCGDRYLCISGTEDDYVTVCLSRIDLFSNDPYMLTESEDSIIQFEVIQRVKD